MLQRAGSVRIHEPSTSVRSSPDSLHGTRVGPRSFPGTPCAYGCAMFGPLARAIAPLCFALLAQGCAAATSPPDSPSEEEELRRKAKLQLVVTVDWEGRDLRDDNLRAMQDLRTRFPQVKIIHFLNAAYS